MARYDAIGMTISEMGEFAGFLPSEQRYIRRSLDIGLNRGDAIARWARDEEEAGAILAQSVVYADVAELRRMIPLIEGFEVFEPFLAALTRLTAFDLAQGRLTGFSSYRFLYERLLGPEVRPWLPAAFCGAAALPMIHPDSRRQLLQSISEAAATAQGWSTRAPAFFPEFVETELA